MEQNAWRQPRTGFVTDPAAGIEVTLSLIFELLKITDLAFRHGAGKSAAYKLYSSKFFVKCANATLFRSTSLLSWRVGETGEERVLRHEASRIRKNTGETTMLRCAVRKQLCGLPPLLDRASENDIRTPVETGTGA